MTATLTPDARQLYAKFVRQVHTARKPFVGCDGEGKGEGSTHRLWIMRCGDAQLAPHHPLGTVELLEFLCAQPRDTIPVGYHFNYDSACILKDLPVERLTKLYHRELRAYVSHGHIAYWPVDWHGYQIDLIPKKYLAVRRRGETAWYTISDVIGFFQASFLKAITDWEIGTDADREFVHRGKLRRGDMAMDAEDEAYNALECKLLAQLMEAFRIVCEDAKVVPHKWQGAGYLAGRMLQDWKVPKTGTLDIAQEVWDAGLSAYYGGRFEATRFGEYGPCYEADINSAYPDALRSLPCLAHSHFRKVGQRGWDNVGGHALGFVRWKCPNHLIGPFPVRVEHRLVYPLEGKGYYWRVEIEAAQRLGYQIEVLGGYECVQQCRCTPFDAVREVYSERIRLGKDKRGYPLKLGPNSLYGKCAQRNPPGPWTNYLWAGLVTATTRAKLLRAMCQEHEQRCIYAFATDAMYSAHPLEIDRGTGLGQWSETPLSSMFLIQPGVYVKDVADKGGGSHMGYKRRGFRAGQFAEAIASFRTQFASGNWNPETSLSFNFFTGWRLALARGKPETGATWATITRRMRFDILSKRTNPVAVERDDRSGNTRALSRVWLTQPYQRVDKPGGNVLQYELDPEEKLLEWDDGDEYLTLEEVIG